ncbi:MAG: hypothetical protein ACK5AZ_07155 [Bryobacteraceae bacterium]
MSRREFLLLLPAALPILNACSTVRLAGVEFEIIRRGRSNRRYLLIHGDEHTAREVLYEHMRSHSGVAHLVTGKTRNIPIDGGEIDPNRLFSRVGAERNLRRLNPGWGRQQIDSVLDRLDRERPRLLQALLPPEGGIIIALHNNQRGYSLYDELQISDDKALNDPSHPNDFYLCTDRQDYQRLAASPYNVLLQSTLPPEDDGSLSQLAIRLGIRYVNIEAALGELRKQQAMLQWLERALP